MTHPCEVLSTSHPPPVVAIAPMLLLPFHRALLSCIVVCEFVKHCT